MQFLLMIRPSDRPQIAVTHLRALCRSYILHSTPFYSTLYYIGENASKCAEIGNGWAERMSARTIKQNKTRQKDAHTHTLKHVVQYSRSKRKTLHPNKDMQFAENATHCQCMLWM